MRSAVARSMAKRNERGISTVELLVTLGIVAILLAALVQSLDHRHFDLAAASQRLGNDLREARLEASLRGAHFRLTAADDSYSIARLRDEDGDGIWQVDPNYPERSVRLPPGLVLSAAAEDGSPTAAEFNSRGVLVDPAGRAARVIGFVLRRDDGEERVISVWPSGQVRHERLAAVSS